MVTDGEAAEGEEEGGRNRGAEKVEDIASDGHPGLRSATVELDAGRWSERCPIRLLPQVRQPNRPVQGLTALPHPAAVQAAGATVSLGMDEVSLSEKMTYAETTVAARKERVKLSRGQILWKFFSISRRVSRSITGRPWGQIVEYAVRRSSSRMWAIFSWVNGMFAFTAA